MRNASMACVFVPMMCRMRRERLKAEFARSNRIGSALVLDAPQLPVYEHLHERAIRPNWIIGASIGAVTGAILAGNAPMEAVKYQILIMFLVASGTGFGTFGALWLGARRLFDERQRVLCGLPAMLADFALAKIEFGMLSAVPVNQDAKYRRFDIDNDLFDNRADDPLLKIEGRGFIVPQCGQVRGKLMQIVDFLRGKGGRRWIELGQLLLQRSGVLQRFIPAPFQGSRHETVLWLRGIVLTLAAASFKAGAFKLQLKLAPLLRSRIGELTRRLSQRLHPN